MAGAKGYKPPLRVQSQGGDHCWGLALDQDKGLKAWLKAHGPRAGGEALVPLPAVALLVLKQVSLHVLHSMLRGLIVQLQHQHLGWGEGGRQFSGTRAPQHSKGLGNQAEVLCLTPAQILISGVGAQATLGATHYGESSILRLLGKSCRRTPNVAARSGILFPMCKATQPLCPRPPPCPACYLPCRACHSQIATVFTEENLLDAQTGVITVGIKGAHLPR